MHQIVPSRNNGIFALPATIVTALFVGTMAGLMFASIILGGREDDRATRAAREALAEQRRATAADDARGRSGGRPSA